MIFSLWTGSLRANVTNAFWKVLIWVLPANLRVCRFKNVLLPMTTKHNTTPGETVGKTPRNVGCLLGLKAGTTKTLRGGSCTLPPPPPRPLVLQTRPRAFFISARLLQKRNMSTEKVTANIALSSSEEENAGYTRASREFYKHLLEPPTLQTFSSICLNPWMDN